MCRELEESFFQADMSMSMSMSLSYHYDFDEKDLWIQPNSSIIGDKSPNASNVPVSCTNLQVTHLDSSVDIDSTQDSISFNVFENMLENKLHEMFSFCDDLTTRRQLNILDVPSFEGSISKFYIGKVDLDEDPNQGKLPILVHFERFLVRLVASFLPFNAFFLHDSHLYCCASGRELLCRTLAYGIVFR